MRAERFQDFMLSLTDSDMWDFFIPNEIKGCYGALFSATDQGVYIAEVKKLKALDNKLFSDMECRVANNHDGSATSWVGGGVEHVGATIEGARTKTQGKKEQACLTNPPKKKRYTKAQTSRFEAEREERRAEGKMNKELFEARVAAEPDLARKVEAHKDAEKERRAKLKEKKKESKHINRMFGLVFGDKPHQKLYEKWKLHEQKYHSNYMSIGHGEFFHGPSCSIRGKDYFYEFNEGKGVFVARKACDILNAGEWVFPLGERLPKYKDYEWWHRGFPLHIDLISDEDKKEIEELAPKDQQPDYPFVYVRWAVDSSKWAADNSSSDESSDPSHQFDLPSASGEENTEEEEEEEEDEDEEDEEEGGGGGG